MLLPQTARLTTEPPPPGLYPDVPSDVYFSWRAASASLLKVIATGTMAHVREWMQAPEPEQTDAMAFGSALHAFILEPERFTERYFVSPKVRRAGKEWEALLAASCGKRILWTDDLARMRLMLAALREQTRTRKLIRVAGAFECCVVWDDEATGLRCKARLDKLLPKGHDIILDYKSAESAEPMAFAKSAANYGYDIQAGFYTDGVKAATGRDCRFLFLAQEKEAPYLSALFDATDDRCEPMAAECGRVKYREGMARLAQALATGVWEGFGDDVFPLQLPAWAVPQSLMQGV
jgi:hypothetical protein